MNFVTIRLKKNKGILKANRICIESFQTSQKLYTELWLCDHNSSLISFKKVSTHKEYEKYEIMYGNKIYMSLYYTNLNVWYDFSARMSISANDKLNLRREAIYLETKEFYVKFKYALHQYLVIDIIKYIFYCAN